MNLNEYQKQAITTKIYDNSVAYPYVILGLVGESIEMYEKLLKYTQKKGEENRDLLKKELGDIAWYEAAWAEETEQMLEDIINSNPVDIWPFKGVNESISDLIIAVGNVAEVMKKALRDNFDYISEGLLPTSKIEAINVQVATIHANSMHIAGQCSIERENILASNIEKLQSRAKRGKIGGSGDVR